jgi:hypothetical protein
MTNTDKRVRFLNLLGQLLTYMTKKNIRGIIAWFHRTPEQQKVLFDEGKSKCDGYKKISPHQNWLAVDLYLLNADNQIILSHDPVYAQLGALWEGLGGNWLEEVDDIYHFEYK